MGEKLFAQVEAFYKSAAALTESNTGLLRESGSVLGCRLDPFHLEVPRHRRLQALNENAYSDWLQWALLVACKHTANPVNLCIALLSPKSPMMESKQPYEYEVPLIQREFPVEEGHAGHAGRLDLFIHFAKVGLTWNIEVKKGTAEEADLAKNIGYSNALAATRQYRHCRHLLLVTEHEKEKYDEFCPVRWEELCVRIRKWIMSHRDGGLD